MGIMEKDIDVLIRLKEEGYLSNNSSIIEIGAQQLSNSFLCKNALLEKLGRLFNAPSSFNLSPSKPQGVVHGILEHLDAEAPAARYFWEWLGFHYTSIDIDGSPKSIPLDLNYDSVPKKHHGKYELVTNFGTTEHVANQLNAFKVIHDLTKVDGIMIHTLPSQGMINHGLINYNPKFFWMLARSNGYKWLNADYFNLPPFYELPQNIIDSVSTFNPSAVERSKEYKIEDSIYMAVLQKKFNVAYVPPLDISTGIKTENKILQRRYWTVFEENVFEKILLAINERNHKKSKSIFNKLKRFFI